MKLIKDRINWKVKIEEEYFIDIDILYDFSWMVTRKKHNDVSAPH